MINWFKSLFTLDESPDLSRRKFIRDAASLAALTVVASQVPSLLKYNELKAQLASGLIENQTFYLTEPVIIDLPNTVIRNCYFVAQNPMPYMIKLASNAHHCLLENCHLSSNLMGDTGYAIVVEPQGDTDMTTTLHSAVDTAQHGDTIYLGSGKYKLSSAIELINNIHAKGKA